MSDEKITCPCCGEDITDFVHAAVTKRIRQINAEKMRRRQSNDPELRRQLNEASAEPRSAGGKAGLRFGL